MPLNVREFFTSVVGVIIFSAVLAVNVSAQAVAVAPIPVPKMGPPTSGEIMRDRISKSKAFIAVRNYNAAIYELENIRKESGDPAVRGVVNVLLMNSYLEQGDYKRAQSLLNEFYAAQKTTMANASASYMAVAGQIIKGARDRAERYRTLGLSVSDRTLPLEALTDLEKMRETLELVITQSKEIGSDKAKAADAMMMLEEASGSRSMLARDDYDSRRWKDELADTREKLMTTNSIVRSAVADPAAEAILAAKQPSVQPVPPVTQAVQPIIPPVAPAVTPDLTREREVKIADKMPSETNVAQVENTGPLPAAAEVTPNTEGPKNEGPKPSPGSSTEESEAKFASAGTTTETDTVMDTSPLSVGPALIEFATSKATPVYPPAARTVRASGVVTVEVMVDENGGVSEVKKASGHMMLQSAAKDAIRKWKFKPFVRNGQPVKATGYVNFSFAM